MAGKLRTARENGLGNENIQGAESHARSFAKAISWRAIALIVTVSIVWLVTDEVALAASVGLLDTLAKIGIYYFHERAWNLSRFGRRSG